MPHPAVFINHSSIKTHKKRALLPLVIPSPAAASQHDRAEGVLSLLFQSLPPHSSTPKIPSLTVPDASPLTATSFPTFHKEQWPNRTFLTSQPRNNPRHQDTKDVFSSPDISSCLLLRESWGSEDHPCQKVEEALSQLTRGTAACLSQIFPAPSEVSQPPSADWSQQAPTCLFPSHPCSPPPSGTTSRPTLP